MKTDLPLLKYVSKLYSQENFENTLIIACQHLLGSTYSMFEELFVRGLKPENVYLLGKCYSTNDEVYQTFYDRGVNISSLSKSFNSHISFDEQFHEYVSQFFKSVAGINNYKKIIILDDGGQLLVYANDFFKDFTNIVGIEQTSSGYTKLSGVQLNFPVINVARSQAKLEIESPMIAELVVEKLKPVLSEGSKVLVMGQGYIGKCIRTALESFYSVNGCDIDKNKCDFSGSYHEHLNEFDVIVGTTGTTVILPGDFGKLKEGVTLTSASSSDREFSASYLRALLPKTDNCHVDVEVNGINLMNGGFPINFDGRMHSVPPEQIQLTRSLLLAAIYEACANNFPSGINDLPKSIQDQIIGQFKTIKQN